MAHRQLGTTINISKFSFERPKRYTSKISLKHRKYVVDGDGEHSYYSKIDTMLKELWFI